MTSDFPSKTEARGGRHKKRNPYASRLRDKQYRPRIVEGKNGKKRRGRLGRELDEDIGDTGSDPVDNDL